MFTERQISSQEVGSLPFRQWLENTVPEWFREYQRPAPARRARFLADRLEASLESEGGTAIAFFDGDRRVGALGLEVQAWDTAFFGFRCGRVSPLVTAAGMNRVARDELLRAQAMAMHSWALKQGLGVLLRRLRGADGRQIEILLENDFSLADDAVIMSMPAPELVNIVKCEGLAVRPATERDIPGLREMSLGAFQHSRFVADPVFGREKGEAVYQEWIANAILSRVPVMVATLGGKPAGYLTYEIQNNAGAEPCMPVCEIGLVLVAAAFQGRGVGSALFSRALAEASGAGCRTVEATTWKENAGAIHLYKKFGLQTVDEIQSYLRHF